MKDRAREKVKIVFDLHAISGEEAFFIIIDIVNGLGLDSEFYVHGNKIDAKALSKRISENKVWPSGLVSNGLDLRFGVVAALKHCFIKIEEIGSFFVSDWDDWVRPFLSRPGFVQAWVSDVDYDYWQNARDPLEYDTVGRDFSCLPMKSNGLPAPLEQMEIDTSNNPGRCELKEGYVEAIGATMWLGEAFRRNVGRWNGDELFSVDWLRCQDVGGVVKLVALNKSFNSTLTADKQRELRSILFN